MRDSVEKKSRYLVVTVILVILMSIIPVEDLASASAAENDWISLPEIKDVPLDKTFTITFNLPVTNEDIDGIVIFQNGRFIPVDIVTKGKQALVTPVNSLLPNTEYDVRVFISNNRYKMQFRTVGDLTEENNSITYKGITDVKSQFANNQLVKNVHHYVVDMNEGYPINIYVTDDYEKRYGKGFAYEETVDIINSIESKRNTKPYTMAEGSLDMFFYTNESNTPLPQDHQAALGSWSNNTGSGVPTEMIVNGSTMPYDFRTSFVHEIVHYFDFQSYITQYSHVYSKYWGPNYSFWLLEGGAEYGGYFFYNYPENTKNNLYKEIVQPNKESIMKYAKSQGGNKENLLYDVELNSFDDIYKASRNNYGITLALFWYLVETYGYEEIYDYTRFVGEIFENQSIITQQDKEKTAIKFFGKTEEEILQDWLIYFDYFGGELEKNQEITTGTANYVFFEDDPLLPEWVNNSFKGQDEQGVYFQLNIEEWIEGQNYTQANSFTEHMTKTFQLTAPGYTKVTVAFAGGIYSDGYLTNGERLHSFSYIISPTEAEKLVPGVEYTMVPIDNHPTYKWVIPDDIKFVYNGD